MVKTICALIGLVCCLVILISLAGCAPDAPATGTVIKRDSIYWQKSPAHPVAEWEYRLRIRADSGSVEGWQTVNNRSYRACTVGKRWPDCKNK